MSPEDLSQNLPTRGGSIDASTASTGQVAHHEHASSNATASSSSSVLPQQGQSTVVTPQPGQQVQHSQVNPLAKPDTSDSAIAISAKSVHSGNESSIAPLRHPSTGYPGTPGDKKPQSLASILYAWLHELVACLLAVLMLVVEIILLAYYDNRNTLDWPHSWKINSIFAFLTAILEAAVAYAVGTCLGQLRWLWFQRGPSQLRWLDKLSNTRSAPGAAEFILSWGALKHWAGVGASLVLGLLGVSVFTQNIITQDQGPYHYTLHERNGSVPISNTFLGNWQYGDKAGDEQPLVPMIAAIVSGFAYPSSINAGLDDPDSVTHLVNCDTGNCTFAEYSSLAVCSACTDISSEIVIPCNGTKCAANETIMYLPDHSLSLDSIFGYVNITSDALYPQTSALQNIGPLIAHYKGMGSINFPETPPYATECAVYWCVQTWNSTVQNSVFNETLAGPPWTNQSASARTAYGDGKNITLKPPWCYITGKKSAAGSTDCTYAVDAPTQRALQNSLMGGANKTGFLSGEVVTLADNPNSAYWIMSSLAASTIISPCIEEANCTQDFYHLFDEALTNMTSYMTLNIRKTIDTGPGYSYGVVEGTVAYFHVRWGWLAYPIAITVITLIFVIVTIIKSRHTEPWKTSVVALILHGLSDADRSAYHNIDEAEAMREAQETWTVTLDKHNGVYAFTKKTTVRKHRLDVASEPLGHGLVHLGQGILEALDHAV